ncbi:hypothetical protein [Clostridium sp. ZS2]|uniref:hypothetical protein n=1 Tax=Clostridium sp. ZS2 TaxID=2949988 RepID=UPI00207AA77F|nr:hypothetical protein [Clostridium sp. ZS2]
MNLYQKAVSQLVKFYLRKYKPTDLSYRRLRIDTREVFKKRMLDDFESEMESNE